MSIASEISRLQTAKENLKTAIEGKGVTVPSGSTLDDFADLVESISSGGGATPTGYTRMKYLEGTGTQGIDTGKYLKLSSKFMCDCHYLVGEQGAFTNLFGSANPSCVAMQISQSSYPSSVNSNYWSFGNVSDKGTSKQVFPYVRGIIKLDKDSGEVKYSDYDDTKSVSTIGATSVTENQNSHICLFCRSNNGTYERFAKARIYEYWYYEGDTLLQHMIPVKRNSDDALGFYDLVNDVFYQNVGTGSFTGIEM